MAGGGVSLRCSCELTRWFRFANSMAASSSRQTIWFRSAKLIAKPSHRSSPRKRGPRAKHVDVPSLGPRFRGDERSMVLGITNISGPQIAIGHFADAAAEQQAAGWALEESLARRPYACSRSGRIVRLRNILSMGHMKVMA